MNVQEKSQFSSSSIYHDVTRGQIQPLFPLESLQSLDVNDALHCQMMLGHGGTFGIWETPEQLTPHIKNTLRRIDLRKRIINFLPKEKPSSFTLGILLDEGVLWLTRMALLMRIGPAGLAGTAKLKRLDVSSIAAHLVQHLPKLVALGLTQRLEGTIRTHNGFASALTEEDLRKCWANEFLRTELKRLSQLQGLGLWSDAPAPREFKNKITSVRGEPTPREPERKRVPHPIIPDDFLAAMGPRVLWLIKDLGPNLIHLFGTLLTQLESRPATNQTINRCIAFYLENNAWHDRNGKLIENPPFNLRHGSDAGKHMLKEPSQHDPCEWPPRHWRSVQTLAVTLQTAHLWLTLLVMAARITEVTTLKRDCVEFARDGQVYVNGKTYKSSRALDGKEREYPMPDILVDVFAQQIKLVELSERIERLIKGSIVPENFMGNSRHLWASLGTSGSADATEKLAFFGKCFTILCQRIGLPDKPGGKALHPHRLRKTLSRLAGLSVDGSQKVLMLLLGHEDVTTTLAYMQSDRAFAKEADDVTRELRIMRGKALIEDMRAAFRDPNSLLHGGHGGGGAPVLADSVRAYEEELHRAGEEWGVNTALDLSVLLTNNGESARLISAHVVCTKTAGEVGLCSSKKGAIVAGNCQTECRNHIEDKTGRRDTERVIPILVRHAEENITNKDWLPLQLNKRQLEQELKRFDDIGAHWRAKSEVQAVLASVV